MAIKIDLRVPPCKPIPEITAFVKECEDAGFNGVGILDSQMLERDVFVAMADALLNTSTIQVASAVTNPVTRHPSVLASAAQTVSEIAPGRAQIWIGRGYSSANVVGIPPIRGFLKPHASRRRRDHPGLHRSHRPQGHEGGRRGC